VIVFKFAKRLTNTSIGRHEKTIQFKKDPLTRGILILIEFAKRLTNKKKYNSQRILISLNFTRDPQARGTLIVFKFAKRLTNTSIGRHEKTIQFKRDPLTRGILI
jgi:hypothetical protein